MGEQDSLKGVWSVLREIKDELKDIDRKWEEHIERSGGDRQKLDQLVHQVGHIEQVLTRGNGQPPVLARLAGLAQDVETLKADHRQLKTASGLRSPEEDEEERKIAEAEAVKARWAAVAKVAGVLALAVPGILAALGYHS